MHHRIRTKRQLQLYIDCYYTVDILFVLGSDCEVQLASICVSQYENKHKFVCITLSAQTSSDVKKSPDTFMFLWGFWWGFPPPPPPPPPLTIVPLWGFRTITSEEFYISFSNWAHCSLVVRGRLGLYIGFLICLWVGQRAKGGLGPIWWFLDLNLRILQCIDFQFYIPVRYIYGKVVFENGHYPPTDSPSVGPKGWVLGPIWWFSDVTWENCNVMIVKIYI